MRLVVFTTETPHHAFFCRELAKTSPIDLVVIETTALTPPFPTAHPFEANRDFYERSLWFLEEQARIADFCKTIEVQNINEDASHQQLSGLAPDLIVTFGTRKLSQKTISMAPNKILNLHGGDPRHYRGLDSHLWACYHKEFHHLATCLHFLRPELDSGEIIGLREIPLHRGMKLHQLRAANTEACVTLTRDAIAQLRATGNIHSNPQQAIGRYYSHMPAVMKEIARKNFEKFTEHL